MQLEQDSHSEADKSQTDSSVEAYKDDILPIKYKIMDIKIVDN